MPTAYLLNARFRPSSGLHRSTVDEVWHVTGITGWNADTTQTAVFSAVPRVQGQVHPDLTECICLNITLAEIIGPTEALVSVFFSTNHSEVRRFRTSSMQGFTGNVRVPYWTQTTTAAGASWRLSYAYDQREHVRRVETRYARNGSLTDAAIATMLSRVGGVFRFPDAVNGTPYLLKSPSIVDYAPGQSRLIYTFETSCPLLAMPAGSIGGQNQALPALNFLEEWFAPEGGSATPLPIVVRPWQTRYRLFTHADLPLL